MRRLRMAAIVFAVGLLGGCEPEETPVERRPERVLVHRVVYQQVTRNVSLTGSIYARIESQLSFQIDGRVVERLVDVADRVREGDVLARLDPAQQEADVAAAEAALSSAEATLEQAQTNFTRQARLLESGVTTRGNFEDAREQLRNAEGGLNSARAQLANARERLTFTELRADADGVITERRTETGQVAAAAQPVFTLAHDGDREAIFDVYESLLLQEAAPSTKIVVRLISDPSIDAKARVREVSPTLDSRTGTVRIWVTLIDPPQGIGLGAAVEGIGEGQSMQLADLPSTALSADADGPAVWVVDASTNTVSLRSIEIESYQTGSILVRSGLVHGEKVVTVGSQLLRDGQLVEVAKDVST